MLKKTIAKFYLFVIIQAYLFFLLTGCAAVDSVASKPDPDLTFQPPRVVGEISSPDITESSGLAASRCRPGVLWTHNDSGDGAFIFAIDPTGKSLGTWRIPNAENVDWEDIAAFKDRRGICYLYIGEIGNNKLLRKEHTIYRIVEPSIDVDARASTRAEPRISSEAEVLRFRYPGPPENAETLMVDPQNADIYILTKRVSGPAGIFRVKSDFGTDAVQNAEAVGELSVPSIPNGMLTGGDISPDRKHLIVCDYAEGYEYSLPGGSSNFDEIWRQKPVIVDLGKRSVGEAVTYSVDGSAIFATSEKRNSPLLRIDRKQ